MLYGCVANLISRINSEGIFKIFGEVMTMDASVSALSAVCNFWPTLYICLMVTVTWLGMLVVLYVMCMLIWPWPDLRSRSQGDDRSSVPGPCTSDWNSVLLLANLKDSGACIYLSMIMNVFFNIIFWAETVVICLFIITRTFITD